MDDPVRRRRPRPLTSGPRLVVEGRSGRATPDLDLGIDAGPPFSSYDVASHGPDPVPDWVITSASARDTTLGPLKSGKEADVALLERAVPSGPGSLLAVKTYRDSHHRMFHRDSGYQEGRRTRRSRESRAMATRTAFGRELLASKWATAEFAVLSTLWRAGANVPYPVQMLGSELMMEFIGSPDGVAAPRLSSWTGDAAEFTELWHDLVAGLEILAQEGLTHGDLSPYNVLVHQDRCVIIDLPQAVDVIANPQGETFLRRDTQVIAGFFARRGVLEADGELLALHLGGIARG
ncbi:serine protein kinase RIO [Nakamurella panacisegetis]|uniref:serine protein kinase RIO n=1 Tax=Nakamurella panacisegetis TaxID=1090615 RepID=UPI000B869C4E